MSVLLAIEGVTRRFGPVTALDRVTLEIRENEFFALLGASGSGKTTLLRMLAGFEQPQEGRIRLDGADITRLPPERRPVNLMFQSYALFPHMTVRGNVAYGLEMERLPRREIDARVNEILETTQLAALAERRPDQLSGGQKQRVALARALVKRPRLLLLDEPLGALDKKLRAAMQLELKRLQHEVGITFVVVTHDQEEALVMADRIAILRDGRVEQVGTPHEVYEAPSNRNVADFIGLMNFFEEGGRTLAIRPERIALFPTEADRTVAGRVVARAYHGLDLMVHVATPLAPQPLVVRVTADAADRRPVAEGDSVTLGWNTADVRTFES
ncbi:spermidine/putrescine transport system ATP-binding protein/putrescine transport system ATP-binding protein [Tepidamorphus gemmatus]|uniref:Spermidine/putrescine import ATP-binding protein PotA n=1 Tax=Tepidamorphus gemmatus TaxID=747076 RepID=A0A4R3LY48_9HYPH|nr:ABC transporter ATP-binding protein [Tepidamorphus gemmatus]TCT03665.1 spermidine/putrescine transport system ATP-binding protein/putrescine transport system ATP-binding protein [Tepidamorphus gemmatus]